MPDENELEGQISSQNNLLSGIVQIGRIIKGTSADPVEPMDTIPRVLVQVGSEDEGSYSRNWMPWVATRAGYDAEWWRPELDEQVLVLAPSGNLAQGIIGGTLYRGALSFDQKEGSELGEIAPRDPIPEQEVHQRIYQDGTSISYDRQAHKLSLALRNTEKMEATGVALLNLIAEIEDGKGKASLLLGEESSPIKITADAKSGSEKITLTAGTTEVTINKDGTVDIAAGSNDITIAGNIKVTGTLDVS